MRKDGLWIQEALKAMQVQKVTLHCYITDRIGAPKLAAMEYGRDEFYYLLLNQAGDPAPAKEGYKAGLSFRPDVVREAFLTGVEHPHLTVQELWLLGWVRGIVDSKGKEDSHGV